MGRGTVFTDGRLTARTLEDLQRLFVAHGSNEVYARIGTCRVVGDGLEQALARARIARRLGLPLSPEIGLWPSYGGMPDFRDYPQIQTGRPWEQLDVNTMAGIAHDYGAMIAKEVLAIGVVVNSWNLSGDERGIGGLTLPPAGPFVSWSAYRPPDAVDPAIGKIVPRTFELLPLDDRIAWSATHLWPHVGRVLAALADGIRSIEPDARFSTHIGSSPMPAYLPRLIVAFFEAIESAGYRVDEPAVCLFPSSTAVPADRLAAFKDSLVSARSALGRPFFIAEHAYPVARVTLGGGETEFANWGHANPSYPLSEAGQADITRDLVAWGVRSGNVSGIRQWAPDLVSGSWAHLSLFECRRDRAVARPAIDSVTEGLRLAAET